MARGLSGGTPSSTHLQVHRWVETPKQQLQQQLF
jgi:hypothetical protein